MSDQEYLTISEVTQRLNSVLQSELPLIAFKGELSQCSRASSGHCYFSLKDEKSQILAVMWRGVLEKLSFVPRPGMEVLCFGRPNVYGPSGKLQIVLTRMEEAGEGLLQRKFLELKAKLEREGLFAASRKRSLPLLPNCIGIVTSKSGAAIHDMMTKIQERMPIVPVLLFDSRVQGEGAAEEIASGIQYFQSLPQVDVLIIGRGGGSLEDLWPFNEEVLVRAVFASRIPVISAVGHEVDTSLSDLAADVRAPTPTAAGELVVPRRQDLLDLLARHEKALNRLDLWFYPFLQRVDDHELMLRNLIRSNLQHLRFELERLRGDLGNLRPDRYTAQLRRKLEEHRSMLRDSARHSLENARRLLHRHERELFRLNPLVRVRSANEQLDFLERRLQQAVHVTLREQGNRLREFRKMLQALNHEKILERGFAIVRSNGKLVRSSQSLRRDDLLDIRFAEGQVEAVVGRRRSAAARPAKTDGASEAGAPAQGDLFREVDR